MATVLHKLSFQHYILPLCRSINKKQPLARLRLFCDYLDLFKDYFISLTQLLLLGSGIKSSSRVAY
jgi:hypothetical protein